MSRERMVNGLIAVVITLLVTVLIAAGVWAYKTQISNFLNPEKVETVHETIVTERVEPPTIESILQFRKDIRECEMHDSVFLHMPETALIAILIKKGTEVSNSDIAQEYLKYKTDYDNVEFGAQINEIYKQHILSNKPDTLPVIPKTDIPTPNLE